LCVSYRDVSAQMLFDDVKCSWRHFVDVNDERTPHDGCMILPFVHGCPPKECFGKFRTDDVGPAVALPSIHV
jgi:hypothetical protein